MSDLHRQMRIRTRKDHRCAYCRDVIPKGTVVLCEHGIYDHEPYRRYACMTCEPHVDEFWKWTHYECDNPLDESFAYFMELRGDAE